MSESATDARKPACSTRTARHYVKLFVLAVIASAASAPVLARTPYDGAWSVVIMTRSGACQPTSRYGMEIVNGRVIGPGGSGVAVRGWVSRAGTVNVSVRAQGQWATGSGRLGGNRGAGLWQGQGTSGSCAGTWVAQRSGFAPPTESGPPVYNYAPRSAPMWGR